MAPTDGIPDAPSKETAELLEIIEARGGPNYSNLYEAEMARNRASHEQLANWSADAFDAVATVEGEGTAAVYTLARTDGGAADAKDAAKEDGKLLSSYGWGAEGGAPAPLSFYAHAKTPADVLSAQAWSKAGA